MRNYHRLKDCSLGPWVKTPNYLPALLHYDVATMSSGQAIVIDVVSCSQWFHSFVLLKVGTEFFTAEGGKKCLVLLNAGQSVSYC